MNSFSQIICYALLLWGFPLNWLLFLQWYIVDLKLSASTFPRPGWGWQSWMLSPKPGQLNRNNNSAPHKWILSQCSGSNNWVHQSGHLRCNMHGSIHSNANLYNLFFCLYAVLKSAFVCLCVFWRLARVRDLDTQKNNGLRDYLLPKLKTCPETLHSIKK